MYVNHERRSLRSPGGDSHDLFGAEFLGSPRHHRVLKPPGGGTSDIFGGSETEKPVTRKKSVQASNIVLNDEATTKSGSDAAANPLQNGHAKQDASVSAKPAMTNGKITNGSGEMNGVAAATIVTQSASRGRVPPGGYSSGLW